MLWAPLLCYEPLLWQKDIKKPILICADIWMFWCYHGPLHGLLCSRNQREVRRRYPFFCYVCCAVCISFCLPWEDRTSTFRPTFGLNEILWAKLGAEMGGWFFFFLINLQRWTKCLEENERLLRWSICKHMSIAVFTLLLMWFFFPNKYTKVYFKINKLKFSI